MRNAQKKHDFIRKRLHLQDERISLRSIRLRCGGTREHLCVFFFHVWVSANQPVCVPSFLHYVFLTVRNIQKLQFKEFAFVKDRKVSAWIIVRKIVEFDTRLSPHHRIEYTYVYVGMVYKLTYINARSECMMRKKVNGGSFVSTEQEHI